METPTTATAAAHCARWKKDTSVVEQDVSDLCVQSLSQSPAAELRPPVSAARTRSASKREETDVNACERSASLPRARPPALAPALHREGQLLHTL